MFMLDVNSVSPDELLVDSIPSGLDGATFELTILLHNVVVTSWGC